MLVWSAMNLPFPSIPRENRLLAGVLFLLVLIIAMTQGLGGGLQLVLGLALVPVVVYLVYQFLRWYQEDHRRRYDLTNRLAAQIRADHEEVVAKDRIHKAVFDSAAEGLLVVDEHGDLQMVNRAGRSLFAMPEGDYLSGMWDRGSILLKRDSLQRYQPGERPLDRALRGEAVDLEIFQVRTAKHPEGRWLSCSAHPIGLENSAGRGAIMVARDITTLMDAQDHLQQSEQRLRSLVEKMPAIVWTTDQSLVFQSSQGSALKGLGLAPDELVGKTMFDLFDTRDKNFKPIAHQLRALEGHSANYEFEWNERSYTVSVEPITDPAQRITGSIGIALDVTRDAAIQRQIHAARQVQQQLFPASPPMVHGYDFGGGTFPAAIAAGDYFDYMEICDGTLGLVVGDVSGHGIGPALLMADTRAYLRVLAHGESQLETILERANSLLYHDTEADKFVTLFLGKLDPARQRFRYASAGHATAFVLDANGEVRDRLESTTTPLGLFRDLQMSPSMPVTLANGELLLVLTDGVTDASPDEMEFFGEKRALDVVRQHRNESAQEIVESLHDAVRDFLGGQDQNDDVTALILKVQDR